MTMDGPAYAAELRASFVELLSLYDELTRTEIETLELGEGWTPKTLLAHVGFWDDYQTRRMEAAVAGVSAARGFARPAADNDLRLQLDQARPWAEIVAAARAAHVRMADFATELDEAALGRTYVEGEDVLSLDELLQHMIDHTRHHAEELSVRINARSSPRDALLDPTNGPNPL